MTSLQIERAIIGKWTFNLWTPQSVIAATNTTGIVGHEADILVLQRETGWLYEIEVKVSASDFRKEFTTATKIKKHEKMKARLGGKTVPGSVVRKFYFAMPLDVYEKVKDEIPEHAGIITVRPRTVTIHKPTKANWNNSEEQEFHTPTKVREAPLLNATKAGDEAKAKLLESVYYAFWRRKTE